MNALKTLRHRGWLVGNHYEYVRDGEVCTFWLFVKNSRYVKGEGRTDEEALSEALCAAERLEGSPT